MTSQDFVDALIRKVKEVRPEGYGETWTQAMYPILHDVGTEADFEVNCKPFVHRGKKAGYGELYRMDFWYSKKVYDPDEYIYLQPTVIIEHENSYDYLAKRQDFLKVCSYIADLRVFIGYCDQKWEADEQATQLMEFYNGHSYKQLSDGETLILLSWDHTPDYEWLGCILKGNTGNWKTSKLK